MSNSLLAPPGQVLLEDMPPSPEESATAPDGSEQTTLALFELLLKNPARVDQLNREPEQQGELFPRFLLIGLTSYLIYSFGMLLILTVAPAHAYPHSAWLRIPAASWSDGTALSVPLAYTIGIVLAACVCLPSFYFYSLLAGARMTWLQIVSLVGKGTAANAIMLLGIMPIYVAVVMGMIVFEAPADTLQWTLNVGLVLPFVSGLWGLRSIYQGTLTMVQTLPEAWQCRRRCFLRRLTFAWSVIYAAVLPIMVYRLWETFGNYLRSGS